MNLRLERPGHELFIYAIMDGTTLKKFSQRRVDRMREERRGGQRHEPDYGETDMDVPDGFYGVSVAGTTTEGADFAESMRSIDC